MIDLISEGVGGRVVSFNDEFFADAKNLIRNDPPVWKEGKYTDHGKWMDGWETRRRREPGHDWCDLALGIPGRIKQITVDTSHFTGNFPERFSVLGCGVGDDSSLDGAEWVELITETELTGDSVASYDVTTAQRVTYVKLNIYPDGGVARLRIEGEPIASMSEVCPDELTDLLAAGLGGVALEASDVHYSSPSNLLRSTEPAGMWDGWETRRRRGPGSDWSTFQLGIAGLLERAVIDTRHFKGNCPGWVSIDVSDDGDEWSTVIDRAPVVADSVNKFDVPEPVHAHFLKMSIHPDGGVARLRALGRPDSGEAGAMRILYLNSLFDKEAQRFFNTACGSNRWSEIMMSSRPYTDVDAVESAADEAFAGLGEEDWLEAFAAHPRIGESGDVVANREQAAASDASWEVQAKLLALNEEYEDEFGFIYIVYATGKTAEEMLEIARDRLTNTRAREIEVAAEQQKAITETRLRRMLCQEAR
jgi:allantoicase